MPRVKWIKPGEGVDYPLRLQTRLRAWWEGYDTSALRRAVVEAAAEPVRPPPVESEPASAEPLSVSGKPLWTAARINVAETLWGQDFLSPGGVEHTAYLVKPFGITSSMSILDLSAGLGGVARTIAGSYKAWVTGLESSPLVAQLAMQRSEKSGLGKQAPVYPLDLETLQLDRRYDGIFAKEAFFTVQDKNRLFDVLAKGLKPGGHLLFTDYCADSTALSGSALSGWMQHEPVKPNLWAPSSIATALKTRGLDVRINEDMTELQQKLILSALGHFTEHLDAHSMDAGTKTAVLDEVELWARRMAAFSAGLRVYRFYCLKH